MTSRERGDGDDGEKEGEEDKEDEGVIELLAADGTELLKLTAGADAAKLLGSGDAGGKGWGGHRRSGRWALVQEMTVLPGR